MQFRREGEGGGESEEGGGGEGEGGGGCIRFTLLYNFGFEDFPLKDILGFRGENIFSNKSEAGEMSRI